MSFKQNIMDTEENVKEYRWETGYERTWEAITEDNTGGIEVSVQEMLQRARRKKLLEKSGNKTKLGIKSYQKSGDSFCFD